MKDADVSLDDKEWIEYIDALRATGDVATAAEAWEAQRSRLGIKDELAELFWITGVRLYVQLGKPQKAQRVAFECYDKHYHDEPRSTASGDFGLGQEQTFICCNQDLGLLP